MESKSAAQLVIKTFSREELVSMIKPENLLPFNRDVSLSHVNRMFHSVESCGLLRLPIIGKLEYYDDPTHKIIDGQHLVQALLGFVGDEKYSSVQCILKTYDSKMDVIKDVAMVNNTQKSWKDEDYLDAWYKYGKDNEAYYPNYEHIYNLYKNSILSCGLLIEIYATDKEPFRNGTLAFNRREFSDNVFEIISMLANEYGKMTYAYYGLLRWCVSRVYVQKKEVDFKKLRSRLVTAFRTGEDNAVAHNRDSFSDWVGNIYARV